MDGLREFIVDELAAGESSIGDALSHSQHITRRHVEDAEFGWVEWDTTARCEA